MLDADGLGYEDHGDGEAVLMIHGAAIATTFVPLMREPILSERYRVIRYHRRGFSGSTELAGEDKFPGHAYAAIQVQDALTVLRSAGVDKVHVIGHSGGGWVGVQLALDAPDVVHSLVLMEPAIYAMKDSWKAALMKSTDPLMKGFERDPDETAELFCARHEGPNWRSFADTLPGAAAQWTRDTKRMYFELQRVLDWTFRPEEAARISQPVLFMTGGDSPPLLEKMKALFSEWVPQTEGVVIPNEGHNMFTQRPAPAARAIASFLSRHPMA
jgi:pimeloyl-ACP methyl ester carboxylesterase